MGIIEQIKNKYADYRLNKINKLENSVKEKEGCVMASALSPEKLMPDKLKITLKTLPKQLSIAKNMEFTVKSLKANPKNPGIEADNEFFDELENYAKSVSIDKVGYVKVPQELIFKDKAISYENAIILIMEMDKKAVDAAPSDETQEMGVITYDELGKKTNEIANFLREKRFGSHASHPAGGFVMYPHLAQYAGLGYRGRHGMLITPEFGPRQRISVIFTSIQNLPVNDLNEHLWIPDFCAKCGKCIRKCPGNAIVEKDSRTKIIKDLCHGCTICMRDCSFNNVRYENIRNKYH
ncbi:4Fe-4S binding protein [Methanobacterium sp. ACI-7]|uniref:4Fe-4S binding protein n=1 Tax=unclassified Methanobacterium TaxID=2627676 RepID=UPI0039C39B44